MRRKFLLVVLLNALIFASYGQTEYIKPLEKGIYMVVGSFQNKGNAIKFRSKLEKLGKSPSITFSDQTGFYYVYIQTYKTVDEAIPQVSVMRSTTQFTDAWVLSYSPDSGMTATSTIPFSEKQEKDSLIENPITSPSIVSPAIMSSDQEEMPDNKRTISPIDVSKYSPEKFMTDKNQYKVIFNTYNVITKANVNGSINIIDPDRLKIVQTANAHELSFINDPHNQSNSIEFIAEIFGYKKAQYDLKLDEEIRGETAAFLSVKRDTLMVDFPLKRYEKGDVAIMYNVFFYKDAAIMKPESQFEINSLLELLKENPNYKISISGHTNGNTHGKIIEIDNDVPEYFSLSQATKEGTGSAKKLSLRRAEIIRKYLVNNGISEDRMEVVGYGGKKPIYEKFDRLAFKNVRVEIEILQD